MRMEEKEHITEGIFSVEVFDKGVLIDAYTQKNKIMTNARVNMANVIAGKTDLSSKINKIVLGDLGHSTDLLTAKTFEDTRTLLFSEDDAFVSDLTFSTDSVNSTITSSYIDDGNGNISGSDLSIFENADTIEIVGSKSNDGTYTVTGSPTNTEIQLDSVVMIAESAGALVTVTATNDGAKLDHDGSQDGHTFYIKFDSPTDNALDSIIEEVKDTSDTIVTHENITVDVEVTGNVAKYVIFIPQNRGNNAHDGTTDVIAYTEAALYADDKIFSMRTFPARTKEGNLEFKITWSITF